MRCKTFLKAFWLFLLFFAISACRASKRAELESTSKSKRLLACVRQPREFENPPEPRQELKMNLLDSDLGSPKFSLEGITYARNALRPDGPNPKVPAKTASFEGHFETKTVKNTIRSSDELEILDFNGTGEIFFPGTVYSSMKLNKISLASVDFLDGLSVSVFFGSTGTSAIPRDSEGYNGNVWPVNGCEVDEKLLEKLKVHNKTPQR